MPALPPHAPRTPPRQPRSNTPRLLAPRQYRPRVRRRSSTRSPRKRARARNTMVPRVELRRPQRQRNARAQARPLRERLRRGDIDPSPNCPPRQPRGRRGAAARPPRRVHRPPARNTRSCRANLPPLPDPALRPATPPITRPSPTPTMRHLLTSAITPPSRSTRTGACRRRRRGPHPLISTPTASPGRPRLAATAPMTCWPGRVRHP
ncbi:hypothetical protein BDY21DRAFT_356875 [Lineolata rhizophorae]|uniref:Uncharacterized protein n=1 Tax=Lineolata rhizophorae TaxID=578093 RepID=A0A6A6NP82_9PEZI|nr:hypothetical protein BDY21DRAFT_356875 [Lineolata rhizophorae]